MQTIGTGGIFEFFKKCQVRTPGAFFVDSVVEGCLQAAYVDREVHMYGDLLPGSLYIFETKDILTWICIALHCIGLLCLV